MTVNCLFAHCNKCSDRKKRKKNSIKLIANSLKPLCRNEYKIDDTQSFPSMLKQQTPLSLDEEFVLHDIESLLTKILVDQTISYIINEIYKKNNIQKIVIKLTTENSFQFNYNL